MKQNESASNNMGAVHKTANTKQQRGYVKCFNRYKQIEEEMSCRGRERDRQRYKDDVSVSISLEKGFADSKTCFFVS